MQKIAVAEDMPLQREMLKAALSTDEREIQFYPDGLLLYQSISRDPPDLVILDIIMPRLSGLAATRLLRYHRKTKDLKIVVVSSITDNDIQQKATRCGCDIFFSKPLDFNKLDTAINDLLA